jgi:hypothetical protein
MRIVYKDDGAVDVGATARLAWGREPTETESKLLQVMPSGLDAKEMIAAFLAIVQHIAFDREMLLRLESWVAQHQHQVSR